jgi:hypothetical protein
MMIIKDVLSLLLHYVDAVIDPSLVLDLFSGSVTYHRPEGTLLAIHLSDRLAINS